MRARPLVLVLVVAAVFVVGHLSGWILHSTLPGPGEAPARLGTAFAEPADRPPVPTDLTSEEQRDIAVFRDAAPSVVYISSLTLRRDFFSRNVLEIPQGTGSGFVWDRDGHVVTNYHVISAGSRYSVVLSDGSEWEATRVGVAPRKDLAVLKIDAPRDQLRPIQVGTSSDLLVGRRVLAIGNPFGLDQTLTIGVVSALGRELESPARIPIRDIIQTDAAINPGNSGGPLLDSSGRLVGINTAIYSPTGAYSGIGFAVPVDTVRRLVPQLIEHGQPITPGIGINLVPQEYLARWRLDGLAILDVTPGGPADRAGLVGVRQTRRNIILGDRILAVDGTPVDSVGDLVLAFEAAGVGGEVTLRLARENEERDVRLELVDVTE